MAYHLNVRNALCALLCTAAMASWAGDLALVSVTQLRPGEVVARVSFAGAAPLRASELALRFDGSETVPAAGLAAVPAASALLLCVDRSGSMGEAAVRSMQAALRASLAPREGADRLPFGVAIVAFGTRSSHLLGLTDDASEVAAAVARISVERERDGKTKLNDAIAGGLAELRASPAPLKRLLVISDGNDEGSDISQAALVRRASMPPSIPIDAVGYGALASSSGSLATLAGATGGRFRIVNTQAQLAAAIGSMTREMASTAQFDVNFRYAVAADGRLSESPVLVYRPQGGTPTAVPLRTSLVVAAAAAGATQAAGAATASGAVASGAAVSAAAPAASTASTSQWLLDFTASLNLPQLPWIIAGLAVVLLLAFLLLRKRSDPGARDPAPPPPPVPAPAPTIVHPPVAPGPSTVAPPPARERRDTMVSFRWPLPGDGRTVAVLRVASGTLRGRRLAVTRASTSIGSAPDNDLVIEGDDYVSGRHAAVRAEAGALYIVDLGSANGTELHGARFKNGTRSLSPNDRFTVGRTAIEVNVADMPSPGASGLEQGVR